jgi:LacI family transcriptional regulator
MATTIKDVARLAGVGVGTASRVISGKGSVAGETAERVRAAIKTLNFRPSSAGRALATRTMGMLGLYVPHFSGLYYGPILQAVDSELREVDRHMVVANGCGAGDGRQLALDGLEFLMQRECDGIVISSNELLDSDLLAVYARFPKIAVLNRIVPGLEAQCFGIDHGLGGRIAARALLAHGHRDIAVISGMEVAEDNAARMAGFHADLAEHGLVVPEALRTRGDFSFESGARAANELLTGGTPFTALFAANDLMAMAAMSVFGGKGLRLPQDVSVIGYDDSALSAYTTPALSTVRIPITEFTRNACRQLINRCYGLELPVTRDFAPSLVWRGSVVAGPHPVRKRLFRDLTRGLTRDLTRSLAQVEA